jgi:hypothetical protein
MNSKKMTEKGIRTSSQFSSFSSKYSSSSVLSTSNETWPAAGFNFSSAISWKKGIGDSFRLGKGIGNFSGWRKNWEFFPVEERNWVFFPVGDGNWELGIFSVKEIGDAIFPPENWQNHS